MINIRGCELNAAFLASRMDYNMALDHAMDRTALDAQLNTAVSFGVHSVCVNPHYLEYTLGKLEGTKVITAVSLDFPWGGGSREIKAMMAEDYASRGAQAIEHTLDIAAVKNGDWVLIQKELADLTKAAQGAKTCAVIESCLLTAEELSAAAQCCQEAGLSCIALGTGKQKGPEWNDLMMLDELLGEERTMKIRYGAIGSFWTTALAINGFAAGADYLGITAVEQILKETPMLKALYEAVKAV